MLNTEDFLQFLQDAPTSYHCVEEVKKRLQKEGFSPLTEETLWQLQKGGKYFVHRGGSIAAFCLPKAPPSSLTILAAHTDSPALKLKPSPIKVQEGMNLLSIEVYGGPILHSWLNRDIKIAGRYFTKEGKEHLIDQKEQCLMIPEVAIHLDRELNKGRPLNRQEHLMPLVSLHDKENPLTIESLLNISDVESFDLFLVPAEPPSLLGLNRDWIASYRIDNLTSVHAATAAIASYEDSSSLPIAVFFDHEEIGSLSWEGARSSFLSDLLVRIKGALKLNEEAFLQIKRSSICYSLDMAHAIHPLHGTKHDPGHRPFLGKGLVIKEHSDQKYATSAYTKAIAKKIAHAAKVKTQDFACRADVPSGSTVGPAIAALTGIATVDLGCPQLSMHSTREIVAVNDYLDSVTFLKQALKPPTA